MQQLAHPGFSFARSKFFIEFPGRQDPASIKREDQIVVLVDLYVTPRHSCVIAAADGNEPGDDRQVGRRRSFYESAAFNTTKNVLPWPGELFTPMRPPCATVISRAMESPRPAPVLVWSGARKKRSKIRA
jgi:hypothetical protein